MPNQQHKTLLARTLLLASLTGAAFGQAPLTTIQDVLFKADGARFSGTVIIHWSTFDATLGTVGQQSKTVSVFNGNLQVQLAPNVIAPPPANVYSVSYQSDGREQFGEIWSVPVSSVPLTIPQVRIGITVSGGSSSSSGSGSGSGAGSSIAESSVIGLLGDLSQRPAKGPGFGTGAVAVINSSGQVETAVGTLGDCIFVDGTSGPCGVTPSFVDAEVPAGVIDGANTAFTLQNPPSGASLVLSRNGINLTAGADYTLASTAITFINNAQPQTGDTLRASYRLDPAGAIGQIRQFPGSAISQVICSAAGRSVSSATLGSLGACDIPASAMHPGDRFEARFTFAKSGSASAYDIQIHWNSTTVLARHATAQDNAFTGTAEATITAGGEQISLQSWGITLPFLPGIVTIGPQVGVHVDFLGGLSSASADMLTLSNFTVLRYPAN